MPPQLSSGSSTDPAPVLVRPRARASLVGVGPLQDLFLRERWLVGPVPDAASLPQKLRQRGAAGKPPMSVPQRAAEGAPRLAWGIRHASGLQIGPVARTGMVGVGPGEDLLFRQVRPAEAAGRGPVEPLTGIVRRVRAVMAHFRRSVTADHELPRPSAPVIRREAQLSPSAGVTRTGLIPMKRYSLNRRSLSFLLHGVAAVVGTAAAAALAAPPAPAPGSVSFYRDVFPILQRRCAGCHQPAVRSGKLSVVTYAALKSGGVGGPGFVTGKPADSPLYKTISGKKPTMPKDGPPLGAAEVEKIRLWIVQGARDDTPEPRDPISAERPPVYAAPPVLTAVAYSPGGDLMAVSGYREVLLHRGDGSGLVARLVGRSQRIESLAFSPDGKTLAAVGGTSCRFGELQLWDVATRKLLKSVEVGFDVLYGASFAPDGKSVAFGGAEKSAYLYSVPEGRQLIKFDNHSDWVFGTTFSRDGKNMVTTSRDRAIKLVEIATKNFVDDVNYQVYNGGYFAIARNPQADEVAVGGEEGLVRYYSVFKKQARTMNREDYNLLRTFEKMPAAIYAVAFNGDGSLMAVGGQASEVWVFKTADGSRVATLKGFKGSVHGLAWHPKTGHLAVAGFDGRIRVYAVPSAQTVREFVPMPLSAVAAVRG